MFWNLVPTANQGVVVGLKNSSVEPFELPVDSPAVSRVCEQAPLYYCRRLV